MIKLLIKFKTNLNILVGQNEVESTRSIHVLVGIGLILVIPRLFPSMRGMVIFALFQRE